MTSDPELLCNGAAFVIGGFAVAITSADWASEVITTVTSRNMC